MKAGFTIYVWFAVRKHQRRTLCRRAAGREERKIRSIISKMSLEEKAGLLHGNSKFYVGAIPRLGIPELALSDGPHGVRAEINRDNWSYAGWTNDSSTYFPTGTALAATWNPDLACLRGEVLGEEARFRGKDILLGPGGTLFVLRFAAETSNT